MAPLVFHRDFKQVTREWLQNCLQVYGVAVILNTVKPAFYEKCSRLHLEMMSKLTRCELEEHTHRDMLPPQEQPWDFKSFVSNSRWLWKLRCHTDVLKIFQLLLGDDDLISGSDGFRYVPQNAEYQDFSHFVYDNRTCFYPGSQDQQNIPYMGKVVISPGSGPQVLIENDALLPGVLKKYIIKGHVMSPIFAPAGSVVVWRSELPYGHIMEKGYNHDMHLSATVAYRKWFSLTDRERFARYTSFTRNKPTRGDLFTPRSNRSATCVRYKPYSLLDRLNKHGTRDSSFYECIDDVAEDMTCAQTILVGQRFEQ